MRALNAVAARTPQLHHQRDRRHGVTFLTPAACKNGTVDGSLNGVSLRCASCGAQSPTARLSHRRCLYVVSRHRRHSPQTPCHNNWHRLREREWRRDLEACEGAVAAAYSTPMRTPLELRCEFTSSKHRCMIVRQMPFARLTEPRIEYQQ